MINAGSIGPAMSLVKVIARPGQIAGVPKKLPKLMTSDSTEERCTELRSQKTRPFLLRRHVRAALQSRLHRFDSGRRLLFSCKLAVVVRATAFSV